MAKRKHKSKRKRDDLLEPLEQLSNKREEAGELIKKAEVEDGKNPPVPVNCDIEQNIREIRAILKMNAEILDRCMKFMVETEIEDDGSEIADDGTDDDSESSSSSSSSSSSYEAKTEDIKSTEEAKSGKVGTTFSRITYEVVTTRAWNDETQVITQPIRTTKKFNTTPLSKLPEGIDDIIVSDNMTGKLHQFIDFEAFFQKSFLLHETVLEQFLPKLKEHLMSIQVCMGEIDAWVIQEPQGNISYLEETFEMKMEIPDENVTLGRHQCECETHDPNEICLRCGKTYYNHKSHTRRCDDEDWWNHQSFQCQYYQVLKQYNSTGKLETTFNLTNEKDRTKLEKFLEFITID